MDRKVTRFKLQNASFDGLLVALMFADARVRIEEEIPDAIPFIEGIEMSGGFLDGQSVRFSRNLTCIIGGRGAGKSTLIEVARSIADTASQSKLVDSEVWPDSQGVCWRDQSGAVTTLRRQKHEEAENEDDPFGVFAAGRWEIDERVAVTVDFMTTGGTHSIGVGAEYKLK